MSKKLLLVALMLACAVSSQGAQLTGGEGQGLLMTPDDPVNSTYPNATVFVSISTPGDNGCTPWWERVQAGGTQCPKACAMTFDTTEKAQLTPLQIKVEKGTVSRILPRPIKGAFLNVSATVPRANPDEFQSIASNAGLLYVQYSASGTIGVSQTASLGLVKKDPSANGQAVAAKVGTQTGQAKHIPYCFFNVTWTIVAPGSIKGVVPAAAPDAASKKAAAPAPALATSAKKAAVAPAPVVSDNLGSAMDITTPATGAAGTAKTGTASAKKAAAPAPAAPADNLDGGF